MSKDIEDSKLVHQSYQLISQISQNPEPPRALDMKIHEAAIKSIDNSAASRWKKYYLPISIAASVLLTVGVVLKLGVIEQVNVSSTESLADTKRPMYMLQRSKAVPVETMVLQLNSFLDNSDIEKARRLYKKIRFYYPDYKLGEELSVKLSAENII